MLQKSQFHCHRPYLYLASMQQAHFFFFTQSNFMEAFIPYNNMICDEPTQYGRTLIWGYYSDGTVMEFAS